MIPKGTILMAMYGQGKTRGQVAILGLDATINQACAAILLKTEADRDYVYQQLRFRYESIRALSNTGSQENLNAELIREIAFPLPAVVAQKEIAEVLGTWDAAIQKTEQLIAAKERHPDALIQRLYALSDRRGELSRFCELLTESMVAGNSGRHAKKIIVKLYGKGVLAKEEKRRGSEQTQYFVRCSGQLIYSKLDFLNGAFGIVPPELDGYESTLDPPAFDISPAVNADWLLGYLTRPTYYTRQLGLARGQRKARRVHPADLLASSLRVPPRDLQDRIARILSSSPCDIDESRRLLDLLKTQKRGLMQKLLTGQWRLPVVAAPFPQPISRKREMGARIAWLVSVSLSHLWERVAGGRERASMTDPRLLKHAKALRKNMTDAEQRLWYHLRGHRFEGTKFKRQKPIGPFIVDFVCVESRLVIELDGGQHAEDVAYDQRRDAWLKANRFRVLRFWNNEVMQNLPGVLEQIREALAESPAPPAPQAGEQGEPKAGKGYVRRKQSGPGGSPEPFNRPGKAQSMQPMNDLASYPGSGPKEPLGHLSPARNL